MQLVLMVRPSALLIALQRILDRPPAKWNWYLAHSGKRPDYRKKSAGPQPLGKQWREPVLISTVAAGPCGASPARERVGKEGGGAGPDIHGRGGPMWSKPRPRISVSRAWWRAQRV